MTNYRPLAGCVALLATALTIPQASAAEWLTLEVKIDDHPVYSRANRTETGTAMQFDVSQSWCDKPDKARGCLGRKTAGEIAYHLDLDANGHAIVSSLRIGFVNSRGMTSSLRMAEMPLDGSSTEQAFSNGVVVRVSRAHVE